jgi:hypothetical protein
MKNLHILPTDKPSRLWTNNLRRRLELDEFPERHPNQIAKHIYITNGEEIKEGDWYYDTKDFESLVPVYRRSQDLKFYSGCKKIILTTDQYLIKDCIQAIDDEFLEWFVNNPSCEEVEIYRSGNHYDGAMEFYHPLFYKIILPKEEPKKEPLEEAAEKWFKEIGGEASFMKAIEFGVKWQQEQDKKLYSEEEVIKLLQQYRYYLSSSKTSNIGVTTGLWFEQFKKK